MSEKYSGWRFDRKTRRELLARFPPRYHNVVADHVTFSAGPEGIPMPDAGDAKVVGHADDGTGVEALVVAIGGTTDRPDGSTWHITWSLAPGRRAKESNDVIAARGWVSLDEPIPIPLFPAEWEWHD